MITRILESDLGLKVYTFPFSDKVMNILCDFIRSIFLPPNVQHVQYIARA